MGNSSPDTATDKKSGIFIDQKWFPKSLSYRSLLIGKLIFILSIILIAIGLWMDYRNSTSLGGKILFVVDTSLSMNVVDIQSSDGLERSRLTITKDILQKILTYIPPIHPDISIGLMSYGSTPILWSPITKEYAPSISMIQSFVPEGGSSLDTLLAKIAELYDEDVAVYLFSDGGGTLSEGESKAIRGKFTILSVGTPLGGAIPLGRDLLGNEIWKEHNGEKVIAPLNTKNIDTLKTRYRASIYPIESVRDGDRFIEQFLLGAKQNTANGTDNKPYLILIGVTLMILSYFFPRYTHKTLG